MAVPDFISDDDMQRLEAGEFDAPSSGPTQLRITASSSAPSFISDADMAAMEGGSGGDWVDKVNNYSDQILQTIKPFASGAARGTAGLLSAVVDYGPTGLVNTLAKRLTGEETTGDMINRTTNELVGPSDPEHPYLSAAGEMFPGIAIPGGSLFSRAASTAGAGLGAGYARANELGPLAEAGLAVAGGMAPALARSATSLIAPAVDDAGRRALRASVSARSSDYKRGIENIGPWSLENGEDAASFTKTALDDLQARKLIGDTAHPGRALTAAIKEEATLQGKVKDAVQLYDKEVGRPVFPNFDRTLEYIEKKVPAHEVDSYMNELESFSNSLQQEGNGKLGYLQNQKVTWGSRYEEGNEIKNGFNRAVYNDLRDTIEKAVPEVRPINREMMKYEAVRPILERNLSGDEAKNVLSSVLKMLRTSGGTLTTPTLIGATLGGASGGPVGAVLGAGLTAGITPAGQKTLGRALVGLSDKLASDMPAATRAIRGGLSASPIVGQQPPLEMLPNSRPPVPAQRESKGKGAKLEYPESAKTLGAPPVAPINYRPGGSENQGLYAPLSESEMALKQATPANLPYIMEAIRQTESSGGKNTTSKDNGNGLGTAKGDYQLLDSTGKDWHKRLGITDPYDPYDEEQARTIATAYLSHLLDLFDGDVEKAITAYHSGEGNVQKGKIGPAGRNYFPTVEKHYDRLVSASDALKA